MYDDHTLGQTFNVARTAPTMRTVAQYFNVPGLAPRNVAGPTTTFAPKPAPKPVAPKPARTLTTTTRPVSPVTPVLKLSAPSATPSPAPALIPTSSGGGQVLTVGGGASSGPMVPEVMTMDAGGGFADTLKAFSKSPLPLIIFGVLALALSEKGRK